MLSDTEWNLESLHTRQRIQAGQFCYWTMQGVLIWIVCVIGVVVVALTPEQRQHLVMWLFSSALSLTPMESIGWRGPVAGMGVQQYAPAVVRDWLNYYIYGGPVSAWLRWAAWAALLPFGVIVAVWWRHIRKKEPAETHIRGAQILKVEELGKRLRKAGQPGLEIATVRIPQALERSHVLVCGATGSGKSVTIRGMLRQIAARREPVVCVDLKGSFIREFYTPSRSDVLLNPLDARCPSWSPWLECHNVPDMMAQAASLFPVVPGMHATTAFYNGEAAKAYTELLERHVGSEAREIPGLLDGVLKKGLANRAGVLQTLERACQSFRYVEPGERSWSAKEWVKKPEGWVFLSFRETEKAACLPIVSLWLESITRQILTRPLGSAQTIWVIIDELAGLQAQPTLTDLMTRGREYGGAVVIGFQTVLQLYPLYGRDVTGTILGQPATQLYLRSNNAETQEWCGRNIGEREVLRKSESQMVGLDNRDTIHRTPHQRTEAAVLSSQFGTLPALQGYLRVGHHGTAKVNVPWVDMVEREPAFVPREQGQLGRGKDTVVKVERKPPERGGKRLLSSERRAL